MRKVKMWLAVGLMLSVFPTFVIAEQIMLFSDDFNKEAGSNVLNYNSFANWDVSDGAVDIIVQGGYGISCAGGVGKCIDLDGTVYDSGRLVTKQNFNLLPGVYTLSFAVSGNQRGNMTRWSSDTLTVSLGNVYSETFTKTATDPFEVVSRTFTVSNASTGHIVFENAGGDDVGIILDNVRLNADVPTSTPEPATIALLGMGVIGLAGLRKKFYNRIV